MEIIQQLGPFILMFVVIYFFMIRPQMKRQKLEKKFTEEIRVGTKIVTKSGMHGKILELKEETFTLETLSGKIKFERSAISMEMSQKLNAPKTDKK